MLEKTLRANRLFDFYGELLTDKQRKLFHLYYREDWSLSEVADSTDVSRQAVHDGLQRAMEQLRTYEAKLELIETFDERRRMLRRLKDQLEGENVSSSVLDELDSLVEMNPEASEP